MDVTRVAVVEAPRPVAAWQSSVTIALAALVAIGFFVAVAVPYLRLDDQVFARYASRRVWLLLHIGAGAVALLTGPLQLWLGVSGRTTAMHRRLGVAYATSVGIGAFASFYLAAHTNLGWGFAAGITGLGIAWVATTTLAIAAIRRGLIEQHRDWMVRSYVVTFAFVTFRALFEVLKAAGVGTLQEQLAASSWFCWAVPLLVTEIVLQGRRIFGARQLGAATMGFAIVIGVATPADAQARLTAADLEGSVRDESGGVLPETLVTVVNTETYVARTIATAARLWHGRCDCRGLQSVQPVQLQRGESDLRPGRVPERSATRRAGTRDIRRLRTGAGAAAGAARVARQFLEVYNRPRGEQPRARPRV